MKKNNKLYISEELKNKLLAKKNNVWGTLKKSELIENYNIEHNNVLDYVGDAYILYEDMKEAAIAFLSWKLELEEEKIREYLEFFNVEQVKHYFNCCGEFEDLKDYELDEELELDIAALEEHKK